jgi:hypothetical protein
MATAYMTSAELIDSIKRRAFLPEDQNTFTDDDFLDLANEEMQMGLVPLILVQHEDYFLSEEDTAIVDGQNDYKIPYRSIGNRLRDLSYEDTNGNIAEMARIPIDHISDYQDISRETYPYTYYVKNDKIILTKDTNNQGGNLVFTFYLRPNQLVASSRIATISAINTTTGEITVDSIPSHFTTNDLYDFLQTKSPHIILDYDVNIVSTNSTTNVITFDPDDLPSTLAVGDRIGVAEETDIPNVPTELHVVLAHRVAARCLEALNDAQGLQLANAKLAEMENKANSIIDNRVEASPQKVVNRHGFLTQNRYRNRRNKF